MGQTRLKAFSGLLAAVLGITLILSGVSPATAKTVSPTYPNKDAELVIDARTGKVYYERNASVERHPASLTKMMTLYLLFEALKKGKTTLDSAMPVSTHAANQKPTKIGFKRGDTISVETAIKAIVVRSANDVAVVIAEYLGGTEANFSVQMTQKARALGMHQSNFHNASGLPDPLQISTAEDMALLARHLIYDFPEYYPYFATEEFTYRGYTYQTHNNLVGKYAGTDGIKTGYTIASGFNLVSSVVRGNNHLIGVVFGGRSAQLRDNEMKRLLDDTYAKLDTGNGPAMAANGATPQWQDSSKPVGLEKAPTVAMPQARPTAGDMLASLSLQPPAPDNDDEDTAESRRDDGSTPSVNKRTAVIVPKAKPDTQSKALVIAAYQPEDQVLAKPQAKPAAADLGEGDIGDVTSASQNWAIQIGAYSDKAQARSELASYAEKSMDVLGQAAHLVVPFQSANGETLYRARFGNFAEREARDVCSRLTQRGQTCFATVR